MKKLSLVFALIFFSASLALAQRTISGVVADEQGEPLYGASVLVTGTTVGTTTDFDGKYSINVPTSATSIEISYTGFTTQEVPIGASNVIDVTLAEGIQITDIVVTALGVSKDEKAIGYAVQQVSGDELTAARESNIVNSLNGKIAGVQITNSSGAVGASSRIVLRGASSIVGNNEPLFVVDGIPIDNTSYGSSDASGGFDAPSGIADINPDDIESMSVLKGPSAAALYGIRAANGVILITTKKGSNNKGLGISFNANVSYETPLRLPSFQNSYGGGGNQNNYQWVDGSTGSGGVDESWGPALDAGLNFVQFDSYKNGGKPSPWVSHPNNIRDFYDIGVTQNYGLSFSGGTENVSYRLSMGNQKQKGMVPNTSIEKINLGGNTHIKVTDKFDAGFRIMYIKQTSDNLPTGGYDNENPVQQMIWSQRQVDFTKLKDYENLPLSPDGTAAAGTPLNWNTRFQNNPYWVLANNVNKLNKDRVIGGLNFGYQFTEGLRADLSTGVDYFASVITTQKAKGSNEYPDGYFDETDRNFQETNSQLTLAYNKDFTQDLSFELTVGGNKMNRRYNRLYSQAPALELPGLYTLSNLKSGSTAVNTKTIRNSAINSLFFTTQVGFLHAIYLDITGRKDWASVLPKENNSFFYPSVSLGVVASDLFSMDKNIFSYLKVRGSWSKVGGIGALSPYNLAQTFPFREEAWGSTLLPFSSNTLRNPNLFSEAVVGTEFGLEYKGFKNRIRFDATYYDQTSKDLLVKLEVSAASGFIYAWDNVGEMRNKGIELLFGADVIRQKDFNFGFDITFAKNDNEVVTLGNADAMILGGQWNVDVQAIAGKPYGVLFGPGYLRSPDGKIVHKNGKPVIDTKNKILGNITPDWTGGITFNLGWKAFSFNTIIDAKMGGDMYSMTSTWGRYAGVLEETLLGREEGIVGDGVKNIGTADNPKYVPNDVVVTAEEYNKAAYSNSVAEGSVFDASYVKLRQLMLGYKLPKKLLSRVNLSNATFSLVGRNVALLYAPIPHIDPESAFGSSNGLQGIEFGQLPSAKSFGFNLNINF